MKALHHLWPKRTAGAILLAASAWMVACGPGAGTNRGTSSVGESAAGDNPRGSAASTGVQSEACRRAAARRTDTKALLDAGRIHKAVRAVEKADALCPETRQETIAARVEALVELGEFERARKAATYAYEPGAAAHVKATLDRIPAAEEELRRASPADLVQQGFAAKRSSRPVEAQKLFDRAIALALRASGTRIEIIAPNGAGRGITSAGFTPDGKALRLARGREVVWVDVASGLETGRLWASSGYSGFVVPEAGQQGLELGARGEARAFDFGARAAGPSLESLPVAGGAGQADRGLFALSRDGGRAAAVLGAADPEVRVWDTATGKLVTTFRPEKGRRYVALRFSVNSALLAAGDISGGLEVWSMGAKEPILSTSAWLPKDLRAARPDATQMLDRRIDGLDIAADGKALFATWGHTAHVYALPSRPGAGPVAELTAPDFSVRVLRPMADRRAIFGAAYEEKAGVWDASTWSFLGKVELPPGPIEAVTPVPGTDQLAVVAGAAVALVDRSLAPPRLLVPALRGRHLLRVGFSLDGKRLVVHTDGALLVFPEGDAAQVRAESTWDAQQKALLEQARLRVAGGRQVVRDAGPNGGPAAVVASCARAVAWAAVSPDGSILATLCEDDEREQDARLWSLAGVGGLLATLRALDKPEAAYVTAPDGRIEFLGPGSEAALRARIVCRVGVVTFPFEVCEGWAISPGLMREILR